MSVSQCRKGAASLLRPAGSNIPGQSLFAKPSAPRSVVDAGTIPRRSPACCSRPGSGLRVPREKPPDPWHEARDRGRVRRTRCARRCGRGDRWTPRDVPRRIRRRARLVPIFAPAEDADPWRFGVLGSIESSRRRGGRPERGRFIGFASIFVQVRKMTRGCAVDRGAVPRGRSPWRSPRTRLRRFDLPVRPSAALGAADRERSPNAARVPGARIAKALSAGLGSPCPCASASSPHSVERGAAAIPLGHGVPPSPRVAPASEIRHTDGSHRQ